MPMESAACAASSNHLILPSGIFTRYTHMHANTLTSEGCSKKASSCGGQRVLKSASWKNSQLLSTWPYTIARMRREGRMDGRMEQGSWGAGECRGGGVGGQRLKLHHKSHPERKHEVTPPSPPFSIHLAPLSPAAGFSLLYFSLPSLCFCVQRVPHGWTRCIL